MCSIRIARRIAADEAFCDSQLNAEVSAILDDDDDEDPFLISDDDEHEL